VIANFLTHGSPALLYEVGKFLQNVGESIKDIYFEQPQIEEAVAKSLQMFGASDLTVIFKSNFGNKKNLVGRLPFRILVQFYNSSPSLPVGQQTQRRHIDNSFADYSLVSRTTEDKGLLLMRETL
jgi:hypothetical protein